MIQLSTVRTLLEYSDWANDQVLTASGSLTDAQLDQPFDMGPGSLRRTLIHTYNGEYVWLQRWKQVSETKWPSESEPASVADVRERFHAVWIDRDGFLATLDDAALQRAQTYRDSRGDLFRAPLGEMLMQGCVHSIHHRAQIVNMLRRLGAGVADLDYMMRIRQPAS